jgi:rRNA maturation RNase YbeY
MRENLKILFSGRRKNRPLFSKKTFKHVVKHVSRENNKHIASLQYVFMNDEELLKINIAYLNHHTYTDIITFDLSESKGVEGEIYVSIDRILENSIVYGVSDKEELLRVMFHGVLHLLGYKDKNTKDKLAMREAETYCINLYLEKET